MLYTIKESENGLIVNLNGDLDHHLSQIVRIPIDKKIEESNVKSITFDFKNTNFMDSSGIGLIMGRYKLLSKRGGKIYVINTNSSVNRIFQISGLYKIVNM